MYILYDVIKTLLPLKSGYFLPHSRVKLYDVNKAQDENNQAKNNSFKAEPFHLPLMLGFITSIIYINGKQRTRRLNN